MSSKEPIIALQSKMMFPDTQNDIIYQLQTDFLYST